MSYITLITLIRMMYPYLTLLECHQVADIHVNWHEVNEVNETDVTVKECKANIREVVEGKVR